MDSSSTASSTLTLYESFFRAFTVAGSGSWDTGSGSKLMQSTSKSLVDVLHLAGNPVRAQAAVNQLHSLYGLFGSTVIGRDKFISSDGFRILGELDTRMKSGNPVEQIEGLLFVVVLVREFSNPMIISAAFLKLGELFMQGNNFIKYCIYKIFVMVGGRAFLCTNFDEIVGKFYSVLSSNDPQARALSLRLFGRLSQHIIHRVDIHHKCIEALSSPDEDEMLAALNTANKLCLHSTEFCHRVLPSIDQIMGNLLTPISRKVSMVSLLVHMCKDPQGYSAAMHLARKYSEKFPTKEFICPLLQSITSLGINVGMDVQELLDILLFYLKADSSSGSIEWDTAIVCTALECTEKLVFATSCHVPTNEVVSCLLGSQQSVVRVKCLSVMYSICRSSGVDVVLAPNDQTAIDMPMYQFALTDGQISSIYHGLVSYMDSTGCTDDCMGCSGDMCNNVLIEKIMCLKFIVKFLGTCWSHAKKRGVMDDAYFNHIQKMSISLEEFAIELLRDFVKQFCMGENGTNPTNTTIFNSISDCFVELFLIVDNDSASSMYDSLMETFSSTTEYRCTLALGKCLELCMSRRLVVNSNVNHMELIKKNSDSWSPNKLLSVLVCICYSGRSIDSNEKELGIVNIFNKYLRNKFNGLQLYKLVKVTVIVGYSLLLTEVCKAILYDTLSDRDGMILTSSWLTALEHVVLAGRSISGTSYAMDSNKGKELDVNMDMSKHDHNEKEGEKDNNNREKESLRQRLINAVNSVDMSEEHLYQSKVKLKRISSRFYSPIFNPFKFYLDTLVTFYQTIRSLSVLIQTYEGNTPLLQRQVIDIGINFERCFSRFRLLGSFCSQGACHLSVMSLGAHEYTCSLLSVLVKCWYGGISKGCGGIEDMNVALNNIENGIQLLNGQNILTHQLYNKLLFTCSNVVFSLRQFLSSSPPLFTLNSLTKALLALVECGFTPPPFLLNSNAPCVSVKMAMLPTTNGASVQPTNTTSTLVLYPISQNIGLKLKIDFDIVDTRPLPIRISQPVKSVDVTFLCKPMAAVNGVEMKWHEYSDCSLSDWMKFGSIIIPLNKHTNSDHCHNTTTLTLPLSSNATYNYNTKLLLTCYLCVLDGSGMVIVNDYNSYPTIPLIITQ